MRPEIVEALMDDAERRARLFKQQAAIEAIAAARREIDERQAKEDGDAAPST